MKHTSKDISKIFEEISGLSSVSGNGVSTSLTASGTGDSLAWSSDGWYAWTEDGLYSTKEDWWWLD